MALSTELQEALARSRRQPRLRSRSIEEQTLLQEHKDTTPVENPDDIIDPDDSALPAPSVPLPSEMPANWWEALLFGKPGDVVSPEDARLALMLIEARLREYQDTIKRDPGATVSVGDELTATVGALHERIEQLYGSRGWFVFQQLYHEAAGLHPRRKPVVASTGLTIRSEAAPLGADVIEPGLAAAISQMPTKLQRWMLAPPYEPPVWRTSVPEQADDDGSWCG